MKYIEMVIRESLRIYPPAIIFSRELTTPLELDGGIVVPERSHVMVPTYCVHRHPNHYHQPETFDPLRFSDEETAKRHRYAFLPFSSGPRDCIGKSISFINRLEHLPPICGILPKLIRVLER
ncbi:hypothetical protein AAG570_002729 [Ranatra chinensis]|uniref:Cytochrome P450 n=1 Tax=Ranatra chinensis TaxID=642074 RepID=A0ABD0YV30_9HEMI